jgi:hypothetical protein
LYVCDLRFDSGFEFLKLEFELFYLTLDLLRAATELHPSQLGNQQLKMLDLSPVREQLGLLDQEHRLQHRGIESVQILDRKRRFHHAHSMPCTRCEVMHKTPVNTDESDMSLYIVIAGCQVRSGLRQSIPSSSIDNCARVSETLPQLACGHTKRPRSSRF